MRTISYKLCDLGKARLAIGYVGENEHTQVRIDCEEIFAEYPQAEATMVIMPPAGSAYPKAVTTDGTTVIWTVTDSDLAAEGEGELQLTFTENSVIVKSVVSRYRVTRSIIGSGEAPDPVQDWVDDANDLLADLEEKRDTDYWKGDPGEPGQDGAPGRDGQDGHTPVKGTDYWTAEDKAEIVSDVEGDIIDDTAGEGDTSKTWSADKIDSEIADVKTDITKLAPVVIENINGETASINDGAYNEKIENLKVRINPVQAGNGDPSPTNVRAISGKTGLTVYHSGEDTSNPVEISVSWQSAAGTVYYGTLDVVTGVLTVESMEVTFDGSSDEGWSYNAYNQYNKYRYYISVSGAAYGSDKTDIVACNWLKPIRNGMHSTAQYGYNTVDMATSKAWLFVSVDIETLDSLKTALASTPLVVVVKLATPQTYNLTGNTINTLLGINNIWSDAGEILQCKYKADTKEFVKEEINKQSVEPYLKASAATLTDNTLKVMEDIYIRKNVDIDFKAYITSLTSLTIGHGHNIEAGAYIVIDSTNVTVYADNAIQKEQYAHGLTLEAYIHVLIQQGDDSTATVIINTLSGQFKKTGIAFNACAGDIFATVSGTLTNAALTTVLHDINKPIWFFGDSYQSLAQDATDRWTYYMRDCGYLDNCLFSGKYGAFSQTLVPSLKKLVSIKAPKYVVWCLGTNGSDSGSVNVDWKISVDEVIELCAEKRITLILATVACTPGRDQTYKNAYVKATGLRYVDFAKAVNGETVNSTWYTGMLGTDDLHPTATGAMALYAQVLEDVPEVMRNAKHGYDVWEGGSY